MAVPDLAGIPLCNQCMKSQVQVGILQQEPCWALSSLGELVLGLRTGTGNELSDHHCDLLLLFAAFPSWICFLSAWLYLQCSLLVCSPGAKAAGAARGSAVPGSNSTVQGNVCGAAVMGVVQWFQSSSGFLDNEILAFLHFCCTQTSKCQF